MAVILTIHDFYCPNSPSGKNNHVRAVLPVTADGAPALPWLHHANRELRCGICGEPIFKRLVSGTCQPLCNCEAHETESPPMTDPHYEIITHPDIAYEDARGVIVNLVTDPRLQHVAWITSKAGAVRANHWHPEGCEQWMYLLRGSYRTVAQRVDHDGNLIGEREEQIVRAGDLVFTPPYVAHAQEFLEESEFLNIDAVGREHEGYGKTHTFPLEPDRRLIP